MRLVTANCWTWIQIALLSAALSAHAQDPAQEPMTFFVTSVGSGDGGNLGGLAGADAHCQKLAAEVGAGNLTWRAYLSTQANGGEAAVHAADRIGNGPWHNAKGFRMAESLEALHFDNSAITREHVLTETGEPLQSRAYGEARGQHDILTGTAMDGSAISGSEDRTCGNWTSNNEGAAQLGHSDRSRYATLGSSWNSAHPSRGCSVAALEATAGEGLFYCFAVTRKIAIFGASGRIGQSIVNEALGRGHRVMGVSRTPEKFTYSQANFTATKGDPTDTASVEELTRDVDAVIIAVGGRTATVPEETAMNLTAIAMTSALAERGSSSPHVVVIGGGMTMLGSPEKMISRMPPSASEGSAMYALFLGHWAAYQTYLKSDINWTFVAPPMTIKGFREGADVRTGKYRTAIEAPVVNADGDNVLSMSDLAVAAVDFAESGQFKHHKVAVGE